MSSTSLPFGLRPIQKLGGTPASLSVIGTIATGYSTAIGLNSPVKLLAGNLVAAAGVIGTDTKGILGTFLGVEYKDASGQPHESNNWPASTTATLIVAYYTFDPYITYEIQANGSIAQSNVGAEADFANVTVNSTTGWSGATLDTASISTSAQKIMRIVGITPGPDNAFGDAFTIVQVQIAAHQYLTPITGIA